MVAKANSPRKKSKLTDLVPEHPPVTTLSLVDASVLSDKDICQRQRAPVQKPPTRGWGRPRSTQSGVPYVMI
jgi:hypothetical protein